MRQLEGGKDEKNHINDKCGSYRADERHSANPDLYGNTGLGFVRRPVAKWVLAILAQAQGIPAAPEKPVKGNIRHALAVVRMHGMVRLVLVQQTINTLAPAPATPVASVNPVMANIRHALVQADIIGRADNVKRRRYGVLARVMRHSVHLGISCSATRLAAQIRYRVKHR